MMDIASKEIRKQANKKEDKTSKKQTKGGIHQGQMQVWIECP